MATTTANSNENSWRFAKDSLPIFLPSWTMPAYMAVTGQEVRSARCAAEPPGMADG